MRPPRRRPLRRQQASRCSASFQYCRLPEIMPSRAGMTTDRGRVRRDILPAGLVVEAAEQALGLQRVVVDFERASGADRSWRAVRAAAEIGVEIFQPERPFRGQLIFEADAGRPTAAL